MVRLAYVSNLGKTSICVQLKRVHMPFNEILGSHSNVIVKLCRNLTHTHIRQKNKWKSRIQIVSKHTIVCTG